MQILSHYTIKYGPGMLMSFEPLAYDTLNFESVVVCELTNSEVGDDGVDVLVHLFAQNTNVQKLVAHNLSCFPLFKKVFSEPTHIFYFKITKQDVPTMHELAIDNELVGAARVQVIIEVESGARATITESMNIGQDEYLGYELNIILRGDAHVDFVSAVDDSPLRTILRNAFVGRNSHIVWHEAVIGGVLVQSHTRTYLHAPGGRVEVKDVFAIADDTVVDMYHAMYHLASHTTSDMLTKGVLYGSSCAMYQGLIHIDKDAAGCTGYQKEDNLILSDTAEVNAVPNLEIENSDVKCSHGVTTAHINKEKLFYARSRGLGIEEATELFVEGHLSSCIDAIVDEKIKRHVLDSIKKL